MDGLSLSVGIYFYTYVIVKTDAPAPIVGG
jgi:hypothetical protein